MQKYIKWFSFKRPPIKQKCLALQVYWEENIPSHLKVEEDMFFSVQSTKNIAKFLFLTSQPQCVRQWEGEWAGAAGLTPRELNDPPGQPYSDQPSWFGGRRARAKSLQSALRGGGAGTRFVTQFSFIQSCWLVLWPSMILTAVAGATICFDLVKSARWRLKYFWNHPGK